MKKFSMKKFSEIGTLSLAFAVLVAAQACAPSSPVKSAPAAAPAATPVPADSASRPASGEAPAGMEAPDTGEAREYLDPEFTGPFNDPATGKVLIGYLKNTKMHYVKDGKLYSALTGPRVGVPVVREDEKYAYVEQLEPSQPAPPLSKEEQEKQQLAMKRQYPISEGEVVSARKSKKSWKFEDISKGLPTTGQWRMNFDLADMDGDGLAEIVAPPPRLTALPPQIFKYDKVKKEWRRFRAEFEIPEGLAVGYGGAAVGDVNKDGKPDIVLGSHNGATTVAVNMGGGKFKLESLGLPSKMTTQSFSLVDLDGDGDLDLVVQSEQPERLDMPKDEVDALMEKFKPAPGEYVKGFDARAFFWENGQFAENSKGLWGACWGYQVDVATPLKDPVYVSSCRTVGQMNVLYVYDREKQTFRVPSPLKDFVEGHAIHTGGRIGVYKGRPAAVVSYVKSGDATANIDISGDGLTLYYEDTNGIWQGKRILKRLIGTMPRKGSPAVEFADLDGDGLSDIIWADEFDGKVRLFFQTAAGEFEEADSKTVPAFANNAASIRLVDIDGDATKDLVLMHYALSGTDKTAEGGFKVFRGVK